MKPSMFEIKQYMDGKGKISLEKKKKEKQNGIIWKFQQDENMEFGGN